MTTAAIRSDWVGRVIDGRFPLLQWLGDSEWSGVFLTELKGSGSQKAAIKLIPAKRGSEKAYLSSWASATTLSHPNLIRLLDTGRCENDGVQLVYAVTEYADEVLSEVIAERALEPDEVREMLVPVLNALFYLHGKGYVHGHLKPSNIMAVDNQLKLSVDSLEVAGEPVTHLRALGVYDAPEVANGVISAAGDIWSLGATLVEVLTQHAPVWDRNSGSEPIVPESMPEPFARIARECLRVDPAQRCTLTDVNKARFGPVRSAAPLSKPASKVETAKAAKPQSIRMGVIGAAAALVLVVLIVALHGRSNNGATPSATGTEPTMPAATGKQAGKTATPEATAAQSSSGTGKGAVAERVLPDVLESARQTIQGTVRVKIQIAVDASGNVTDARFESAGPSRYFANQAMEASRKWRFHPPQVAGRTVRSAWVLQFEFRRTGTEVTPVEVSP